jgi:hypothetical protein
VKNSNDFDALLLFFLSSDIFFLNRAPLRNVKNSEQLIPTFAVPPAGIYLDMVCVFFKNVIQ